MYLFLFITKCNICCLGINTKSHLDNNQIRPTENHFLNITQRFLHLVS